MFSSYSGKLVDVKTGKNCHHVVTEPFAEDEHMSSESIDKAVDNHDYNSSYTSDLPNDTNLIADSQPNLDDLDWVKDNSREERDHINAEASSHNDSEEEEDSEQSDRDFNEYSEDKDYPLNEDVSIQRKGLIQDCLKAIEEICIAKRFDSEKTDRLKIYFTSWLTDEPESFIPETSMLSTGTKYWELVGNNPEHAEFAQFIVPLFSLAASEAVVERVFWFQRRILGDVSMGTSIEVKKAKLNYSIISRKLE